MTPDPRICVLLDEMSARWANDLATLARIDRALDDGNERAEVMCALMVRGHTLQLELLTKLRQELDPDKSGP